MRRIEFLTGFLILSLGALATWQLIALLPELAVMRVPVTPLRVECGEGVTMRGSEFLFTADVGSTVPRILSTQIPMSPRALYHAEFNLSNASGPDRPYMCVDLFSGADYDAARQQRQILLRRPMRNTRVAEILGAGDSPDREFQSQRLIFAPSLSVEVSDLRIARLRSGFTAVLWLLRAALAAHALLLLALVWRASTQAGHAIAAAATVLLVVAAMSRPLTPTQPWAGPDSMWTVPTALSMIAEGNTDIDEEVDRITALGGWKAEHIGVHWYNFHPVGMPLLSLPFVVAGNTLFHGDPDAVERFAARAMFGTILALFFLLARSMGSGIKMAHAVTLFFGLATTTAHCWARRYGPTAGASFCWSG